MDEVPFAGWDVFNTAIDAHVAGETIKLTCVEPTTVSAVRLGDGWPAPLPAAEEPKRIKFREFLG